MSERRIVIIGGSDAGTSAALAARATDPKCRVDLVLEDKFPNYSVCGLPFLLAGEVADWRDLAHRGEGQLRERGIHLHLDHRATALDVERGRVLVTDSGAERAFSFDRLVIATGAEAVKPDVPGADLDGVFRLRTMDDGLHALERIRSSQVEAVAIIGGGYIGVELADALRKRGAQVTLVEAGKAPLKTLDTDFGDLVASELRRNGVEVASKTRLTRIEQTGRERRRLRLQGSDGFEATADVVMLGVGVRPRAELAAGAGCALGQRGAIRVDQHMKTDLPNVFAAGDCVETWHRLLGRFSYEPLGTTAHKQGAVAGVNAAGGTREFAGTVGTQIVKVFDLAAGRTGLREDEAAAAGIDARTIELLTTDRKIYYPGALEMHLRLTGDARSGRLLGAQIVGDHRAAVAKRLDVIATALFQGLRVGDLLDLDLSYTPPLGSPWDPWQQAAERWLDAHVVNVQAGIAI